MEVQYVRARIAGEEIDRTTGGWVPFLGPWNTILKRVEGVIEEDESREQALIGEAVRFEARADHRNLHYEIELTTMPRTVKLTEDGLDFVAVLELGTHLAEAGLVCAHRAVTEKQLLEMLANLAPGAIFGGGHGFDVQLIEIPVDLIRNFPPDPDGSAGD